MNPMKPSARLSRTLPRALLPLGALVFAWTAGAQNAPVSATPAQLARYDANRNGRLDPEEVARLQADAAGTTTTPPAGDVITLSPFTITTTKESGYFAENTLAGSRLNTNLADVAASITVVTKQQMEDTASLDINDVFKYEAGTEGSSSYSPVITDRGTAKDTVAGYTLGNDGGTTTNAQSNRVRGLAAPDAALNYFPTNNRIPFDAYNTQSVEITRGPNSLLFGLGSPAGIVNQSAAQAVLNRNSGSVQLRTDHNGSFRSALSFNRSVIKDKLAVYGAFLYNDQQFERKPSSDVTKRQYGAITFKPLPKTVIRGFVEGFENDANRPNFLTPRDQVTPWYQAGRPAYDPVTRTITVLDTGRVLGPYVSNALSPGYNANLNRVLGTGALTNTTSPLYLPGIQFDDVSRPVRYIDDGRSVAFFQRNPVLFAPAQTSPATATPTPASLGWTANDPRFAIFERYYATSTNFPNPTTTINGRTFTYGSWQWAGVTNKSIYDWTRYNHAQTNFADLRAGNYNLELEQQILPNLFFNAGWLRQDIDGIENYTMSQLTGATLQIDANTKLPDGTANPYFGLPFVTEGTGGGVDTFYSPETVDNYRAMLAYDLDLTRENSWLRWIGRHRLLGLWSKQEVNRAVERWRNGFVDGDAEARLRYVPNLAVPGTALWSGTALKRNYYMASPGDPQGRVSQSASWYGNLGWNIPNVSAVQVYDYNTGQFKNVNVTEQALFSQAGSFKTRREVESWNLAAQSYLWQDRLVTTLGWRRDEYRARVTTAGALTDVTGRVTEVALPNARLFTNGVSGLVNRDLVMNRWNRWDELEGDTKTLGGAFRPLKGWNAIARVGGEGSLVSEFLQSLTFYYNKSDNFNPPATFQTDYFLRPLPKPTGKGKDGGIGFNILKNKLVARVNWYETESLNERTSAAGTLLTRLAYSDTTTGIPWASAVQRIRNGIAAGRTLEQIVSVTNWNTDAANPVNDQANQQRIYDLIKLPFNYYAGTSIGGTQDSKAKGVELQLTYNPTNNWTIKFTADKQQTFYKNVAPQYDAWLAERLPVWQSLGAPEIPDFTDANGRRFSLRNFWTGHGFANVAQIENTDGNTSPQAYFNNVVQSQVALAKALEGVSAPSQRKYRASLITNYRFTEGRLRGFSVGGAQRWESKAAIGFMGKVGDPITAPTVINVADPTRPVYDDGNYYTDLWIAWGKRIMRDRFALKIQLNVNNVFEDGRLLPTSVNFDGSPWAFRIIDPRQFILTTTLEF
jgi:hypothetical protein